MFSQSEIESDDAPKRPKRADEILYTPQEIAERCGLSRRRVYDWLSWGWLRGHRHGGRWVVTADDWDFFQGNCQGARGRLMPSLRDWGAIWQSRPVGDESHDAPRRRG